MFITIITFYELKMTCNKSCFLHEDKGDFCFHGFVLYVVHQHFCYHNRRERRGVGSYDRNYHKKKCLHLWMAP